MPARPRGITYHAGEGQSRRVTFGELRPRALGVLHQLQQLGARPGDKLILLLNNNEQFIDAFWAALLGGIVPVPVAVGISDEHRHKLLRIAHKLGTPFICTDRKTLERVGQYVSQSGDAALAATFARCARAPFWSRISPTAGPGASPREQARRHRLHPVLLRLDQRSQGRGADPRQPDRALRSP